MNLFIGCTSKENISNEYLEHGKSLIEQIACIPNVNLVFGGFHKGLMGTSYDEFVKNKKEIISIILKSHQKHKEFHYCHQEEMIVDTMIKRFDAVYNCSDVFLFLPGGIDTYAEIFSVIGEEIKRSGKKIILYNDNYFYTPMIQELYQLYQRGFVDMVPSDYMVIESDFEEIVKMIEEESVIWKN